MYAASSPARSGSFEAFLPTFRAQGSGMVVNELAEFGVIVRAILPGMSATRIFTKIDRGESIPDAYQARQPDDTVVHDVFLSVVSDNNLSVRRLRQCWPTGDR
jgi:hypothetical protein